MSHKIIKLNKEFHKFVDEEDDEPEFIESDLEYLIVNPNYNNELKDTEEKNEKNEKDYNDVKNQLHTVEIEESKQKLIELKQKHLSVEKCYEYDDNKDGPMIAGIIH